jgi:hypothetical protein
MQALLSPVFKYPAIFFGVIYIVIRLVFFYLGYGVNDYKYLVSINLLFIVLIIGASLYNNLMQGALPFFPTEIKSAMRTVSIYAILISVFMLLYYEAIDGGFFDRKLDAFRFELENTDYSALPDVDNPLKVLQLDKEEFVEREMEKAASFNTPFAWSTLTLVGVMVVGLVYSLIMVFLKLKLLPLIFRK